MSSDSAFNSTFSALLSGAALPPAIQQPIATEGSLPPSARPYAKGAGFHVPPGTANGPILLDDSPPSPLERSETQTPSAESAAAETAKKAPGAQRVTAEMIIERRLRSEASSTREDLAHGKRCNLWVRCQPERPTNEQLDRAAAVRTLTRLMLAGKCDRKSCRVNRFIGCYHVSRLFGGDAESLTITAIREMIPLIERDPKTDAWSISEATAAAARALWQRMLGERLTGDVVRQEVEKIRHPDPLPLEQQRRKTRMPRLHRTLEELSIEELKIARKWIGELLATASPAARTEAA